VTIGPSDLSDLINAINIQVTSAVPTPPTKASSGNIIRWTVALDPAKQSYAVTFSSTSNPYKVSFPSGNLEITQKKPELKESANVVKK
jgi:hypothetical protein